MSKKESRSIMKVCITAQGATPDAKVEERFGRAPYFILMDSETEAFEAVANPFADGAGGVGPKAAQLILNHQVAVLISGLLGGNAKAVFESAGVSMYIYRSGGSVRDALKEFKNNTLERAK
jgi:predicted Fe-Mo cluster-binding NifX family protein